MSAASNIKDFVKKDIPKTEEQRRFIRVGISEHFLFAELKDSERSDVVRAMEMEEVEPGREIITQGDQGTFVYLVEKGYFDVLVNGAIVHHYTAGGVFGELALLYNCPRAATVRARDLSVVWKLDRDTFRFTLASNSEKNRLKSREAVSKVEILKGLSADQLDKIAGAVKLVHYLEGDTIIKKGDLGTTFFMITTGTVLCTQLDQEQVDQELGPDSYFGERALMYNEPRAATIIATSDVSCMTLDRANFDTLLGPLRELLDFNFTATVIHSIPSFSSLPKEVINKLILEMETRNVDAGEVLSEEGYPTDRFVIIAKGEVDLKNGSTDDSHKLSAGAFYDENAMFLNDYKSGASVKAITDGVIKQLSRSKFSEITAGVSAGDAISGKSMRKTSSLKTFTTVESCDDLKVMRTLGTGTFGRVKLVQSKKNGDVYALKMLRKKQLVGYKQVVNVKNEKTLLMAAQHPFILKLMTTFQDANCIYMLLELVQGGELFSVLHSEGGFITSGKAKFYAACVVSALGMIHSKNICYRDLKPENILIDKQGYCKLVDFGFAKVVTESSFTLCGTPEYLSPELVIGKGHNKGVDYWALGILIYEMLCGYSPFHDPKFHDQMIICKNIIKNRLDFPAHLKDKEAKDLISKLLTKDPVMRLGCLKGGAEDIMNHPWFSSIDWKALYDKQIDPKQIPWIPPIRGDLDG